MAVQETNGQTATRAAWATPGLAIAGISTIPVVLAYVAIKKSLGEIEKEREEAKLMRPTARRFMRQRALTLAGKED